MTCDGEKGSFEVEVADTSAVPGRSHSLRDRLVEAGVPEHRAAEVEHVVTTESLRLAADAVGFIIRSLGRSPAAKALEIAVCGGDETLEAAALESGTTEAALKMRVGRIRKRFRESVTQTANR